ncbi:hypothetical protein ACIOK4_00490 [Streptomyces bottropensis]|uniref:hypothetical protein n=1 Tax=Streptomyces bottropensis TaxID=42235 RepID=UPI0036C5FAF9
MDPKFFPHIEMACRMHRQAISFSLDATGEVIEIGYSKTDGRFPLSGEQIFSTEWGSQGSIVLAVGPT